MIEHETVKTLLGSHATEQVRQSIDEALSSRGVAAMPSFMCLHDLEKYQPQRRRMTGLLVSKSVMHFADYATKNKENGAAIFINVENMTATAVLNLGTPSAPGHCDNRADLHKQQSSAYQALLNIATGHGRSQRDVAEFIEDWQLQLECFDDEGVIPNKAGVAAVRAISIETMKKMEATEEKLSASRSTFENIQATSKEKIPTLIKFSCSPYNGLPQRTFHVRVGILTTDKPHLVLRIIKHEEHQEEMGEEFAAEIESAVGEALPIYLGDFKRN